MAHHFNMVKETQVFFELNEDALRSGHPPNASSSDVDGAQAAGGAADGGGGRGVLRKRSSSSVTTMHQAKESRARWLRNKEYSLRDHLGQAEHVEALLKHDSAAPDAQTALQRQGLTPVRWVWSTMPRVCPMYAVNHNNTATSISSKQQRPQQPSQHEQPPQHQHQR
jgi:hypothetical protein